MAVLALRSSGSRPAIFDPASGQVVAEVVRANPLEANSAQDLVSGVESANALVWSGWFGDSLGEDLFAPDHRTWSAPGWTGFESISAEFDALGPAVIIRPHACHVLADPQSTLAWLARATPSRTRILLDPVAWLTPSMLDTAEDHLARACGAFVGHPAVFGVLVSGLEVSGDGLSARNAPLGQGPIPADVVLEIFRPLLEAHGAVVLAEDDRGAREQAALLGRAAASGDR